VKALSYACGIFITAATALFSDPEKC